MRHPNQRIDSLLGRLAAPALATIDLSLDRAKALMASLGHPQDRLPPVVHVAGTNGKGSLLAYLDAMLHAAGYKVHRYTSPHLVHFNERIQLAGSEIDDAMLLALLERVAGVAEHHPVTAFEAETALAFLAFSETPADILLLETGLGGRLDATNLVQAPLLTAITPVSMDHMEFLGDTLGAIAAEKAGILKSRVPCVVSPQPPEAVREIERKAQELEAPLLRFGREWDMKPGDGGFEYLSRSGSMRFPSPGLAGRHQNANAATAAACVQALEGFTVTQEHMARGIAQAQWPARLQRLIAGRLVSLLPQGSELWLDGGHNPAAGEVLAEWAQNQRKPVHLVCGMLRNKDALNFLKPLVSRVKSFTAVTIADAPQGQPPEVLMEVARQAGFEEPQIGGNIKNSMEEIVKNKENGSIILICGSLYLAGNILWQNNRPTLNNRYF